MKFEGGRWTKLTRLERALPPSGRTGATYFRVMLALTIGVSSGTLHTGVALVGRHLSCTYVHAYAFPTRSTIPRVLLELI